MRHTWNFSKTIVDNHKKWRLQFMTTHQSELLQLKNLGMASVNILRAIGINTYADLKRIGAVDAYRRIRARDINVSKVMLYALQGALLDVHWNDLTPDLKAQLVSEAESPAEDNLVQASA
jgi:DNA transformation protein and related proteins